MTSFVIADAGATKISWCLVTPGGLVRQTRTPGLNALLATHGDAVENFNAAASDLGDSDTVSHVFYFGTGCSTRDACKRIEDVLKEIWSGASIEVEGDMVLAARSLLGDRPGVACILGTGSNVATTYTGKVIKNPGAGLGFILGDHGSGVEMGKHIVSAYFKGNLSDGLRKELEDDYGLTSESALENIYRRPFPNRYLASFAPFAAKHIDDPFINEMVRHEFTKFLKEDVCPVMKSPRTEVCFTGSIAKAFETQLRHAAENLCILNIGCIEADPMPGIIKYYKDKLSSTDKYSQK